MQFQHRQTNFIQSRKWKVENRCCPFYCCHLRSGSLVWSVLGVYVIMLLRALVGLANGILLRTEVDRITGKLTDTRTRFLGTRPPKLFALSIRGQRSMIALSSRPWLGYSDMGRYKITPLSYEALDYCSGFSSEQCPEGFCAVSNGTLRILSLERLGEDLNQKVRLLGLTLFNVLATEDKVVHS